MRAIETIASLDDPRVEVYRNLKDRELAAMGGRFIAEGEFVVQRLLASDFPVESVLLAERRVEEIAPLVREGVAVYVASSEVLNQVVGYKFHSGIIACGVRKDSAPLEEMRNRKRLMMVVCPEIANAENLGGLIRVAAAFGADAMVLGERSCDPFFRQSVRVSMGTVFSLPIVRSENVVADLLRMNQWGIETVATVLDESAENLRDVKVRERVAIVFGNEAQGLSREVVEVCESRVTVPMKLGTDSLNVVVSAGVVLYHFTGRSASS
jgi:tRNA G18 (ribose-2'-O)-methylase SpoU